VLTRGGVLLYPTETVYGFGCDPAAEAACARIGELKGWPAVRPMILLAANLEQAATVVELTPIARELADRFWPGPLTLVLPCRAGGTQAVRVSPHPTVQALVEAFGGPITSTSANRTAAPPPTTAETASWHGERGPDMVIDGGACAGTVGSTVVDCCGPVARILRRGDLPLEQLRQVVEVAYDG
jgi:L-threonylcarbamoyladenylate synthase